MKDEVVYRFAPARNTAPGWIVLPDDCLLLKPGGSSLRIRAAPYGTENLQRGLGYRLLRAMSYEP